MSRVFSRKESHADGMTVLLIVCFVGKADQ